MAAMGNGVTAAHVKALTDAFAFTPWGGFLFFSLFHGVFSWVRHNMPSLGKTATDNPKNEGGR